MSKTFNIKPSDAKYIVNKAKKTVVCVIDHTRFLFINFAHDNLRISPFGLDFNNKDKALYEKLFMPNKFIGVATCSEDDEWNVKTGKLIAFSRAKDKLNKSFFKRANTYINFLDRASDEIANTLTIIGEKLSINTNHRHSLINSIIGEQPEDGVQRN